MGKASNNHKREGEGPCECATRLLHAASRHIAPAFRTVVIDEAHFLKNLLAYWGLAAGLLGLHAHRVIP